MECIFFESVPANEVQDKINSCVKKLRKDGEYNYNPNTGQYSYPEIDIRLNQIQGSKGSVVYYSILILAT